MGVRSVALLLCGFASACGFPVSTGVDAGESADSDVPPATRSDGGGAPPAVADAGPGADRDGGTASDPNGAADGGSFACDATTSSDAGPPPADQRSSAPGPVAAADRQIASWLPTGAEGCAGLVPATVSPRLSWATGTANCWFPDPLVDAEGDLEFAGTFFLADGSAGRRVGSFSPLGARPKGYFHSVASDAGQWVYAVAPDGSDLGLLRSDSDPHCNDFIYFAYDLTPDPRGGYVESRIHAEFAGAAVDRRKLEVRWVDANLTPRTPWIVGTTWDYGYNMDVDVYVDVSGSALVTLFFDPPMSMPCHGTMTRAFWASDRGDVTVFTPVTPTMHLQVCDDPQFGGFGRGVVLAGGGVAFYRGAGPADTASTPNGWYTRYLPGAGASTPPPSWLNAHDGRLRLVAGGRAYLATRLDHGECGRTAEIIGAAGQLCATLLLDRSTGCDAAETIAPDGTLALRDNVSCSLRWWPGLGRAR